MLFNFTLMHLILHKQIYVSIIRFTEIHLSRVRPNQGCNYNVTLPPPDSLGNLALGATIGSFFLVGHHPDSQDEFCQGRGRGAGDLATPFVCMAAALRPQAAGAGAGQAGRTLEQVEEYTCRCQK